MGAFDQVTTLFYFFPVPSSFGASKNLKILATTEWPLEHICSEKKRVVLKKEFVVPFYVGIHVYNREYIQQRRIKKVALPLKQAYKLSTVKNLCV